MHSTMFLNFKYEFFFLVYEIVGLVGKCGRHGRNFSCYMWVVNFVQGQYYGRPGAVLNALSRA